MSDSAQVSSLEAKDTQRHPRRSVGTFGDGVAAAGGGLPGRCSRWDEASLMAVKNRLRSPSAASAVFLKALCASLIRSDVTLRKEGLSSPL